MTPIESSQFRAFRILDHSEWRLNLKFNELNRSFFQPVSYSLGEISVSIRVADLCLYVSQMSVSI